MKVILLNSTDGEDYLADLFITGMLCNSSIKIYSNYIPNYLYTDYPYPNELYGMGYSAFCSVPHYIKTRGRLSLHTIEKLKKIITTGQIDFIVYTSIWRYSEAACEMQSLANKHGCKLIVLDGEDHSEINDLAKLPLKYYKRELIIASENIKPISFCLPLYGLPHLTKGKYYIPEKSMILAPCDPRYKKSYTFKTQLSYYDQYTKSLFATTTKKGGWDCLRHYEILANHCVPYFPGIEDKPTETMKYYPVDLQKQANSLYELIAFSPKHIDSNFLKQYEEVLLLFVRYFYGKCTTLSYNKILT